MKKVLATIGAILGFSGLAALVIFFVETTSTTGLPFPAGNLTADISSNNPIGQLADVSANTDVTPNAADAPTPDISLPLQESTPQPAPEPTASDTAPLESPAPTTLLPPAPPPPVPQPQPATTLAPTNAQNTPATSTEATATITVTPTAPPAPPPQPPSSETPHAGDLALPYAASTFNDTSNWQTTWGSLNTTWSDSLDLSAGANGTGGAVYLKNSLGWANYMMTATLTWIGGRKLGLMADYHDASNYVLCDYEKTAPGIITMQLIQFANGYQVPLSSGLSVPWNGDATNLSLGIKVNGIYGTCSWNGTMVSNDAAGPGMAAMAAPGNGGVGFMVSDPAADIAEVVVKNVSVVGE